MTRTNTLALFRTLAVALTVALLYGPLAPVFAETTFEERECERNGGVWNGTSCEIPEPVDLCPNVDGTQESEPCADTTCEQDGGTWNGTSCDMPEPVDLCPNVSGVQENQPCAASFPKPVCD